MTTNSTARKRLAEGDAPLFVQDAARLQEQVDLLMRDRTKAWDDLAAANDRATRAEAALARVEVILDGRHRLPYCQIDGDILVDLIGRIRAALASAQAEPEVDRG